MAKVLTGDFGKTRQPGRAEAASDQPIPGYQFNISLTFSEPLIWRRLQVPGDMTLAEFSRAIQICMGWQDAETHQFLVGKIFYSQGFGISNMQRSAKYDEAQFKLHELEESMHFIFTYLYDGGEGWELDISLAEVFPEGVEQKHPVLLDGERACPPASVGDIHQYQALLATAESGGGEIPPITLEVPGEDTFNPDICDKKAMNHRLKQLT